jgi:hypothetical protein
MKHRTAPRSQSTIQRQAGARRFRASAPTTKHCEWRVALAPAGAGRHHVVRAHTTHDDEGE